MSELQRSSVPSCPAPQPAPLRLVRRLADESGMALVMALAVMLVLTVLVSSTIAFTSSDARQASRSEGAQSAYAAAEAGLNDALAAVQNAGSNTALMASQASPTVTTLAAGATATWYGAFASSTQVWTLHSTGSVPNPTGGGGAAVTRTLTQTATITPPPYNFVSLNTSCDKHALLVESSGLLTVTNKMYIDSCNTPQDAFDIFGNATTGNISDPAGIKVVGGWETHNNQTVTVNGTLCPLFNSVLPLTNSTANDWNSGCPTTGQPVLADPLASKLATAPPLGTPACTGSQTSAAAYSPAVTLNGSLTTTATSVPVKWTGQPTTDPVAVGNVIQVDSEQMYVTAVGVASASKATLTVTRAYSSTTAATHATGAAVSKVVTTATGTAANPAPCVYTAGSVTLNPGTYYGGVCIGSLSTTNCDSTNCTTATEQDYSPTVTLNASLNSSATSVVVKWSSGSDPVAVNDPIQVDNERMNVTTITPLTSTTATLKITRAQGGTSAASHSSGTEVYQYIAPPAVNATLNPGTYIFAGGGFRVCGASTLSAPNVLLYNTQDPTVSTGNGALDQIEVNTTGSVSLGPQNDGAYEGLTIWQDKNLVLDGADNCDTKNNVSVPSQTQINEYDIAFMSAASTGSNGSLGSLSGSIYAPATRADFVEALNGTANLAVLTSCIMVNGGTSTFAFNPKGLFGSTWVLGPQSG